jgi:hypothetical protein
VSIEAMVWAKRTPTGSPTRRLVLYVLADYADENGTCWPSQRTIASQTELSERTVRRALAELEEAHLVTRVQQSRPDGSRTTDRYQLALDRPPGPVATPPATVTGPPGQPTRTPPATVTGHEPTEDQPPVEPPTSGPAAPPPDPALFDAPTVIDELCTELAAAVGKFADAPPPPVTARWRNDMRLLLERGPLHQDTPAAIGPDVVRQCLRVVFTELAEPEGRGGFCWAAQIRSPGALRDHWHQMRVKARQQRERLRGGRMEALARQAGDDPADLSRVLAEAHGRQEQRMLAQLGHGTMPALEAGR